jgi:hypothetical protein
MLEGCEHLVDHSISVSVILLGGRLAFEVGRHTHGIHA